MVVARSVTARRTRVRFPPAPRRHARRIPRESPERTSALGSRATLEHVDPRVLDDAVGPMVNRQAPPDLLGTAHRRRGLRSRETALEAVAFRRCPGHSAPLEQLRDVPHPPGSVLPPLLSAR